LINNYINNINKSKFQIEKRGQRAELTAKTIEDEKVRIGLWYDLRRRKYITINTQGYTLYKFYIHGTVHR
jgi:hypothetical protein